MSKLLRLISLACCAFVLASFALFVHDQLGSASKHQQQALSDPAAAAQSTPAQPRHARAQPRRFIDAVATKLTQPFRSLIHSHSAWTLELFSTVLALLVYGLLLRFLARFATGTRQGGALLKPV